MKRTDITDLFPEATKEQIDKIMDLNGADINRQKGELETLRVQLSAAQNEIETLKLQPAPKPDEQLAEQLKATTDELNGLKAANALRELRERVAKATGVPASLLTGETEEACKAQADAIKEYARPSSYASVRDGGEFRSSGAPATRDQFAEFLEASLKT